MKAMRRFRYVNFLTLVLLWLMTGVTALAQTWTPAAQMLDPWVSGNAILLNTGQVLMVGGCNMVPYLPYYVTTQLYNPTTNSWSYGATMSAAHSTAPAFLLQNGQVIVPGGGDATGNNPSPIVEIYDLNQNVWTQVAPLSLSNWWYFQGCVMADGRVLICGGQVNGGTTNAAQIYDPVTNTWSVTGAMNQARQGHMVVLLPNNQVLATSGAGPGGDSQLSSEVFTPSTGEWTPVASMNMGHRAGTITVLPSGMVLVAGGESATGGVFTSTSEIYNPTANTWTSAGNMSAIRVNACATLLNNGHVLMTGGYSASGALSIPSCDLFDPISQTWSQAAPLITPRCFHTATPLQNGSVLVAGGQTATNALASAELFTPNLPPVMNPIGNQAIAEGQTLSFTVIATNPNPAQELTYTASNLPTGATFDPETQTFTWTPSYTQAAVYPNVLFTVTNNGTPPMQAQQAITITVGYVNMPPVLTQIPNQTVNENQLLQFVVTATDPNGNPVTLSAGGLPTGASFNPTTGMFNWVTAYGQAGNYLVTFTATSGNPPLQVSQQVTITVGYVNCLPIVA